MTLYPRKKEYADRVVTLLQDGFVDVDGGSYPGPTEAARAIANKKIGGWRFFLVSLTSRQSLRTIRREYEAEIAGIVEEDDGDDESDEDGVE